MRPYRLTARALIARHSFGLRAIDVPVEANDNAVIGGAA